MKVKITDIKISRRSRKDLGDLGEMMESMSEHGLLHPVVLTPGKTLICGRRRLESAKRLGWTQIDCVITDADRLKAERDENMVRKDFTPEEALEIANRITKAELKAQKQKRKAAKPGEKLPQIGVKIIKQKAANDVGYSHGTLDKVSTIVRHAKSEPKKYGDIRNEMNGTGNVSAAYRELKSRLKKEEIEEMAQKAQSSEDSHVYLHNKTDFIESEAVDLICTDIPYNISRDRTIDFPDRKSMDRNKGSWDQMPYLEYVAFLEDTAFEFYRMLREGGSVYTFIGEAFACRFREALIQAGFRFKGFVYWIMSNPCPKPDKTSWIQGVDHIAFAVKGSGNTFNWTNTNEMYGYIMTPICQGNERYYEHPAQKPLKLTERLIEVSSLPGDLVADPFAGTGTVGEACQKLNRRFILIEKEPDYVKIIEHRTGIKSNTVPVQKL